MHLRRPFLLGLLLAVALLAAACSDDGDEGGEGPSATSGSGSQVESSEVDRSGRFAGLDEFCVPAEDEEDAEPEAVDDGITADTIEVTHVRVKLEDLAGLGFAVDVGDQTEQFQTFVDLVNKRCGGIHGRRLAMSTVEVAGIPPADIDAYNRQNCIRIAEDRDAVFAFSASGFGSTLVAQCLTVEHEVALLSTSTPTAQDFEAGDGRLLSVQMEPAESLATIVRHAHDEGLLEGKRIAVVHTDAPGDGLNVESGLVATLEDLGYEVVRRDVIGCNNGAICREGVAPAVQGIIADGVDVVFPTLNIISLPTLMAEFVTQGVEKGDIRFLSSNYANQAGDLVSGKIVEFGGEAAGRLYDETVLTDSAPTGAFRREGFAVAPFDAMCNREHGENSPSGASFERSDAEDTKFGSVTTACAMVRIVARALDAAGPNPTREDIKEALRNLGGVDLQAGAAGSIRPGKYAAPDVVFPLVFRYPCQYPIETKPGSCITPTSEEPIRIVR